MIRAFQILNTDFQLLVNFQSRVVHFSKGSGLFFHILKKKKYYISIQTKNNREKKKITSISCACSSTVDWCALIIFSNSLFRSKSVFPSSAANCKSEIRKIPIFKILQFEENVIGKRSNKWIFLISIISLQQISHHWMIMIIIGKKKKGNEREW